MFQIYFLYLLIYIYVGRDLGFATIKKMKYLNL